MATTHHTEDSLTDASAIQQVIYSCLTSLFNEEEANYAIKSWNSHNSSSQGFEGINLFAREVCTNLNQPEKRRDLVKALNRALITKYAAKGISTEEQSSTSQLVNESTHSKPFPKLSISVPFFQVNEIAGFHTFQLILLEIIQLTSLKDEALTAKTEMFMREITENMPWSDNQQLVMLALIESKSLQASRSYKIEHLKSFLKYLKSWLTGEIGAVFTEQIFQFALVKVEKMDEAAHCSPKHLL
jgi:hypothetical protein